MQETLRCHRRRNYQTISEPPMYIGKLAEHADIKGKEGKGADMHHEINMGTQAAQQCICSFQTIFVSGTICTHQRRNSERVLLF